MSTKDTSDQAPLIDIQNLTIRFGAQTVLRNITLSVSRGETLAIIGESGCGKTVLMKTIIGLIRPTSGSITFDGQNLDDLNEKQMTQLRMRFGFVFQLVRAYWRIGDESLAEYFWQLVEDWRAHNPPQAGVNWKCGQEASLRVMAWCFGLWGFAEAAASSAERIARLAQMLAVSGQRISSNLRYALSQRNNHGISEAAGLWTLGTLFPELRQAAGWRPSHLRQR